MFGEAARACRAPGQKVSIGSVCGRWVLVTTVLASGMAFLDDTVVTLALPTIEEELDAGLAGLQWILNGYLLVLGSLILLGGRFGDIFGRRRVLVVGLAIFAGASGVAAFAPSIGFLVGARVVQGVGAALMIPSSLAIITATFRPEDQGQAIGIWSAMTALAVATGPLLGGWLVDAVSWRAVFLINLPLAAVAIFAATQYVAESRDPDEAGHLDLAGAALAVLALSALTFAPVQGSELGWDSPLVIGGLVFGAAMAVTFVITELRSPHPMLPLHFFRVRQFSGANLATLTLYAAIDALFFLSVLQLQSQVGFSALMAGLALVPVTVLLVLLSPVMGKVASRIGARIPMTVGPLVMTVGFLLLSRITPGTVEPTTNGFFTSVFPATTVFGLGLAITVAPLTTAALTALDDRHAGLASGVNTAVARVAGLVGIAILPFAAGMSAVGGTESAAFSDAFQRAMWICGGLAVVSAGVSFVTITPRPAEPLPLDRIEAVPAMAAGACTEGLMSGGAAGHEAALTDAGTQSRPLAETATATTTPPPAARRPSPPSDEP